MCLLLIKSVKRKCFKFWQSWSVFLRFVGNLQGHSLVPWCKTLVVRITQHQSTRAPEHQCTRAPEHQCTRVTVVRPLNTSAHTRKIPGRGSSSQERDHKRGCNGLHSPMFSPNSQLLCNAPPQLAMSSTSGASALCSSLMNCPPE